MAKTHPFWRYSILLKGYITSVTNFCFSGVSPRCPKCRVVLAITCPEGVESYQCGVSYKKDYSTGVLLTMACCNCKTESYIMGEDWWNREGYERP